MNIAYRRRIAKRNWEQPYTCSQLPYYPAGALRRFYRDRLVMKTMGLRYESIDYFIYLTRYKIPMIEHLKIFFPYADAELYMNMGWNYPDIWIDKVERDGLPIADACKWGIFYLDEDCEEILTLAVRLHGHDVVTQWKLTGEIPKP